MEDAICCLQPCFYAPQRSCLLFTHLLFSLHLHLSVPLACTYTGRQLVQKQAPCPPPQTQRWRNWTLSTLSSYNSTLNVSTDRRAGGQAASAALNIPPHTHFHPHTLIYTRSWFLISGGGNNSLPRLCFFFFFFLLCKLDIHIKCCITDKYILNNV